MPSQWASRFARRARVVLFALLALIPSAARASDGYPEAMQSDLMLAKAPACNVCHDAAVAPVGAADQPFARSAVARGLVQGDPASLASALKKMRADGVDSDGDGAEDLDELSWGGDPNHADLPPAGRGEPASYGCSSSGGLGKSGPELAVALAMLVTWRRRARDRRSVASRG